MRQDDGGDVDEVEVDQVEEERLEAVRHEEVARVEEDALGFGRGDEDDVEEDQEDKVAAEGVEGESGRRWVLGRVEEGADRIEVLIRVGSRSRLVDRTKTSRREVAPVEETSGDKQDGEENGEGAVDELGADVAALGDHEDATVGDAEEDK